VRPQVIRNYGGGDIGLPADPRQVIRAAENPELASVVGQTLITTDGTTLLGADDKAGIAVIMELAAHLAEEPRLAHGPIRILFTCDEEIGHGVDHVDIQALQAVAGYTLDGPGVNQIDVETFSADLATVTVRGVNLHPSIGKDRMVNALRAAGRFLARLPRDTLAPESTQGREGFVHPYHISGGVAEVVLKVLLRDFETAQLETQAHLLRQIAAQVEAEVPRVQFDLHITPQYRNLRDALQRDPRSVVYAEQAHENLNRTAQKTLIRGGTDGSQFSTQGLPTPNLSTGQHNPHSPLEWASLDEMLRAVELLVELVRVWANPAN
jgi:tripeptide aminopeptidase